MGWQSVSFLTDASHAEPICDALLEAGALSASIEDADAGTPDEQPLFGEPGSVPSSGWTHSRVVALLEPDADIEALLSEAAQAVGLAEAPAYAVEPVAEQNWVQLTQSQFDPIRVSERLWIVPSWHETPDPNAINLILIPEWPSVQARIQPRGYVWNGWSDMCPIVVPYSTTGAVPAFWP